jgi:hypothetical protein
MEPPVQHFRGPSPLDEIMEEFGIDETYKEIMSDYTSDDIHFTFWKGVLSQDKFKPPTICNAAAIDEWYARQQQKRRPDSKCPGKLHGGFACQCRSKIVHGERAMYVRLVAVCVQLPSALTKLKTCTSVLEEESLDEVQYLSTLSEALACHSITF